jgi:hypothetical protein
MRGVNSTMIHCNNFCKCHNGLQDNNIIKNKMLSFCRMSFNIGVSDVALLFHSGYVSLEKM